MTEPPSAVRAVSADAVTRLRNAFARVAHEVVGASDCGAMPIDTVLPFSTMSADHWREAVGLWTHHADAILAATPLRGCPACGGTTSRQLFVSYDAHRFDECASCGCWFTPRQVDWSTFERFFARCPEGAALARTMMGARDEESKRRADLDRIGGYLDDLLPLLRNDSREIAYLDAGCGVGHSLRAGRLRGLAVQGIEVDSEAIAIARADGLPVAVEGEPLPARPFQLLSFWETLEHIADPLGALQRYVPLLADDGLVAITVPNLDALETRALRESCPWVHGGYNTPGHVNLFHRHAMEALLSRAGLTLLDARGEFSGNPVALVGCLLGHTAGAFDVLDPSRQGRGMARAAVEVLGEIWPGVALIEQLALTSPILQVIACKRGSEARFAAAVGVRQEAFRQSIAQRAGALMESEPDYKSLFEHMEREVTRQTGVLASQQDEINLRDRLLDEERRRYAGTMDARIRRALNKVARLVKGA